MKLNQTNWEWKKLGDICLSKAQYGSGAKKVDFDGKVRYIRITDIDDDGNLKKDEFVSPSIIEEDCFLENDDLLFARSGSVGRTYLHSKNDLKYQFAGYLIRFKINQKIADARYVFYVTKSKYYLGWVESLKRNVTISNINAKEYSSFELPVPPLPIQQKIVSILERAENIKQKREQANEEANKIIQSVFYEMFGNIEDHEVKSFLEVFDVTTGKLDSNAAEPDGIYPFFTCSRETFKINSYDFDCEALLLAGNNAAAKYSVKYYSGKFNAYQRTYVLRLFNKSDSYKFFQFQLENKLGELQDISIGTNTKYLTKGIMKHIKLIVPKPELQKKFSEKIKFIESIKNKQNQATAEINTLFDALMQKAFNGGLII